VLELSAAAPLELREPAWRDIETLLCLIAAPVALLFCMLRQKLYAGALLVVASCCRGCSAAADAVLSLCYVVCSDRSCYFLLLQCCSTFALLLLCFFAAADAVLLLC
jgi:hypothetical protein